MIFIPETLITKASTINNRIILSHQLIHFSTDHLAFVDILVSHVKPLSEAEDSSRAWRKQDESRLCMVPIGIESRKRLRNQSGNG